jgi:hypothetical protein
MKKSASVFPVSALTVSSLGVSALGMLALSAFGLASIGAPAIAAKKNGAMTNKGVLTFYNGQKFQGDFLEVKKARITMSTDFTIGSIAVFAGDKWEICDGERFKGYCEIVTENKTDMGKIMIRSARPVIDAKPAG